jgi:hypothetical protein
MAYAVYSFASQYTDTGQIGVYIGTREENLRECLEITREQIADIAAGNLRPDELARAKENMKGRIMLSMESTSNRMSRLGKSLISDTELLSLERIIAEIEAVEPEELAELAGVLLAPEKLSAAGIGPSEKRFLGRGRAGQPGAGEARRESRRCSGTAARWARCSHRRSRRQGTRSAGSGVGRRPTSSGVDAAVDFTQPDAAVGNVPRRAEAGCCLQWSAPAAVGGAELEELERAGTRAFAAAAGRSELRIGAVLMMRFAEAGGRIPATHGDRRAPPREQAGRAVRDGPSDRGAPARRAADPLGAAAGPRCAPGGPARRATASC